MLNDLSLESDKASRGPQLRLDYPEATCDIVNRLSKDYININATYFEVI